jgi:hypothetical protein
MKSALMAVGLAVLTSPLLAQFNIVTNGDFEKGMSEWSGGGTGGSPGIFTEDLTGLGKSQAFAVYPGVSVLPVNPYTISQNVPLIGGTYYEFTADILSHAKAKDVMGPMIEVKINSRSIYRWQRFAKGIEAGVYREKLVVRFQSYLTGNPALNIEFQRPGHVYTSSTPRIFIDDIQVRIAELPSVSIAGDRKLGQSMTISMQGTPNAVAILFLSPRLASKVMRVPGFRGWWELEIASARPILSGTIRQNDGRWTGTLKVPKDKNLLGRSLYWQGIEISKTHSIGPAYDFNITGG